MTPNGDARRGILLAGGSGTRLAPLTNVVSKQLLPVYDKPMLYYPLSTLMLAGIRDLCVITTPHDRPLFERLLCDGSQWGLRVAFATQAEPRGIAQALLIAEEWLGGAPVALALGDNIFHGREIVPDLERASAAHDRATIFASQVADPAAYGVLALDGEKVTDIVEKPAVAPSPWAVTGLYFFPADAPAVAGALKPSARAELEITDVNRAYLRRKLLDVVKLGRGVAWYDTGTPESLLEAAELVRAVETRQGFRIGCPEEIAWRGGWIGDDDVRRLAAPLSKTGYGRYLVQLLDGPRQ